MSIMMEAFLRRAGISTPMGRVLDGSVRSISEDKKSGKIEVGDRVRNRKKTSEVGKVVRDPKNGWGLDVKWDHIQNTVTVKYSDLDLDTTHDLVGDVQATLKSMRGQIGGNLVSKRGDTVIVTFRFDQDANIFARRVAQDSVDVVQKGKSVEISDKR